MQNEMRTVLQTTYVESACKAVDRCGAFTGLQLFYGAEGS